MTARSLAGQLLSVHPLELKMEAAAVLELAGGASGFSYSRGHLIQRCRISAPCRSASLWPGDHNHDQFVFAKLHLQQQVKGLAHLVVPQLLMLSLLEKLSFNCVICFNCRS